MLIAIVVGVVVSIIAAYKLGRAYGIIEAAELVARLEAELSECDAALNAEPVSLGVDVQKDGVEIEVDKPLKPLVPGSTRYVETITTYKGVGPGMTWPPPDPPPSRLIREGIKNIRVDNTARFIAEAKRRGVSLGSDLDPFQNLVLECLDTKCEIHINRLKNLPPRSHTVYICFSCPNIDRALGTEDAIEREVNHLTELLEDAIESGEVILPDDAND
jgi:hypothetical protein